MLISRPATLTPTEKSVPTERLPLLLEPVDYVRSVELEIDLDVVRGEPRLQVREQLVQIVEPAGDSVEQFLKLANERRTEEHEQEDYDGQEGEVHDGHGHPAWHLDPTHPQDHGVEQHGDHDGHEEDEERMAGDPGEVDGKEDGHRDQHGLGPSRNGDVHLPLLV